MQNNRAPLMHFSLTLLLLSSLLILLWIAGGASRGDALGQVVVRAGAWTVIFIGLLLGPRPDFATVRPVLWLLIAALILPLAQSIPLPLAWWHDLPGRDLLSVPQQYSIWRPWTMVPGATLNALASLVIPAAMLLVFAQANDKCRQILLSLLLVFTVAAVLFGLLQFSGTSFNNPFVNDVPGSVSSVFANRNHFALLVAIGCVLAPVWAFADRDALRWRGPLAATLMLLFLLTILAIGSRAGLFLGALALLMSTALVGSRVKRRMRRFPRWLFPTLVLTGLVVVVGFTALSFAADRVEAVDRLLALAADEDLRNRARPVLLDMIWAYLPVGAGLGSFDAVFRVNEPTTLLALQYFNQAHNDYLGIALDAGLPGLVLLASAIAWWAYATIKVVRAADGEEIMLARLGSAILLLVLAASATDYPARTPIIMAIIVIAGAWLARGSYVCRCSALPRPVPDV